MNVMTWRKRKTEEKDKRNEKRIVNNATTKFCCESTVKIIKSAWRIASMLICSVDSRLVQCKIVKRFEKCNFLSERTQRKWRNCSTLMQPWWQLRFTWNLLHFICWNIIQMKNVQTNEFMKISLFLLRDSNYNWSIFLQR